MSQYKQIAAQYAGLQKIICRVLEKTDEKALFVENKWEKEIGSGITCIIQNGAAFEKVGVNYSAVEGNFSPQMEKMLGEKAEKYSATGISSIIHPVNPHVPIIHMNIRYFALNNGVEWFGGGIDLTPHYIDIAEARLFHQKIKAVCDKFCLAYYPHFKKWADDYFFLPHRNETRGIGGIFFDRLKPGKEFSSDQLQAFVLELGNAYPQIYSEIVTRKKNLPYGESEKKWQQIRCGRYVEFNLIYDRGTKFGLESQGNTESILISLPTNASWEYNYQATKGTPEYATLELLKKDIDWINYPS
jgi:coproporphyrinogen III oxidase